MKIIELKQVPKNRQGSFHNNGVRLEPHEERTAKFLVLYGFSIEVIRPMNTPKMNREMRRMIILTKDKKVLDFYKR